MKDGQTPSQQQTFGSFDLSGVKFPKHVMVDPTTGAAIGVSGAPLFASITNFPAVQAVTQGATSAFSVAKTTGVGTTGTLVSAADTTNRRTIRNTSSIACEIGSASGFAYGAGHPLPAGESFTFDASGRTTAAIYVACASAGGSVSVMSF